MHAKRTVAQFVEQALPEIHGARRRMLIVVICAAMSGAALSLSRLAQGMTGSGSTSKAALKRVDRLVGSKRIAREAEQVAEALLVRLCRWLSPLVIAVDWSAATPGGTFVELRATVVWLGMGRGLTVYQRVVPAAMQGSRQVEFDLLRTLARWIPQGVSVIVISDAGFRTPWFVEVERLGWGFIGRVRRGNQVRHGSDAWQDVLVWAQHATLQPSRLVDAQLTESKRLACDLVRVRRRLTGRPRYHRPGHQSSPKGDAEARTSAREPWVLAHSTGLRGLRPDEIAALYARRMQIEENFRDTKSLPFGMGAAIGRSRSASRLHGLLLIATLASYLLWHIGQLAETEGLDRRFKLTTRVEREISIIKLAILLCTERIIAFSPQGVRALHKKLGIRT